MHYLNPSLDYDIISDIVDIINDFNYKHFAERSYYSIRFSLSSIYIDICINDRIYPFSQVSDIIEHNNSHHYQVGIFNPSTEDYENSNRFNDLTLPDLFISILKNGLSDFHLKTSKQDNLETKTTTN
ncbi:MAG: hypothetical protein RAP70_08700 [Candidatus Celaenobacter antarcticus]|nr:hypothetical protein [Candidatus Celaenobacter antarcticus]